jgi:ATP-dependent DNA helicase RecQ
MNNISLTLHNILHDKYNFKTFRPGQEETLMSVLSGHPTLSILPTGSGKSLLYQLPAHLTNGLIVVISPLISLMQDQVDRIRQQNQFKVAMLNSNLDFHEQTQILKTMQQYRFLFTSPETLVKPAVQQKLANLDISMLVVDEAHCISQWGPNFRPEYLLIKDVIRRIAPQRLLMLTATATPSVTKDIITKMGLDPNAVKIVRQPVDRENIFLAVHRLPDEHAKQENLIEMINKLGPGGVTYFSSKKVTNQVAELITKKTDLRVGIYHAGLSRIERYQVQQQFMHNQLDLICATSAFGMGINKNDIRYVIHYHMPGSIESYVQEFGRAGRDGLAALSLILYAPGDEFIQDNLVQTAVPSVESLEAVLQKRLPLNIFGEEQDLIAFYLQHHYSPQQICQILDEQNLLSKKRVRTMLNYIAGDHCYREVINAYFGQNDFQKPQMCCSYDQPDWQVDDLDLPAVKQQVQVKSTDWQTIIDNLFHEGSI